MSEESRAVHVEQVVLQPVRHPIKAARLLYRAPSAVLRGPIYIIFLIVFTLLVYSFWARKDQLVVVPLKLERESTTLESIGGGMVHQVFVKEGDVVETGSMLMRIKDIRKGATSEDEAFESRELELSEKLASLEDENSHTVRQLELSLEKIRNDRKVLRQQLAVAEDKVGYLQKKLVQAKESFEVEQKLYKNRDITKQEYDRAKGKVDDLEKNVRDAEAEVANINVQMTSLDVASENKVINDIQQQEDRYNMQREQIQRQLASTQKKKKEDLAVGVDQRGRVTTYSSTFSGLVTGVHVKPGQNVGVGTALATVVRESAALEARVLVPNKDIGRLKRGQTVQIKYFAYPYQEYGIPTGVISDISTKPSGEKADESRYLVRIALHEETVKKLGSKPKALEIGLEGVAEIKVGEKRFIELLFSPVSKFFTQEDE